MLSRRCRCQRCLISSVGAFVQCSFASAERAVALLAVDAAGRCLRTSLLGDDCYVRIQHARFMISLRFLFATLSPTYVYHKVEYRILFEPLQ